MKAAPGSDTPLLSVRTDKWLWAARFYKTRQLAITAIKNGRVKLNLQRAKPASAVRVGDRLTIKRGSDEIEVIVAGLSEARGPASAAQLLYQETEASCTRRTQLKQLMAAQPKIVHARQKPDKHKVRQGRNLKRGD